MFHICRRHLGHPLSYSRFQVLCQSYIITEKNIVTRRLCHSEAWLYKWNVSEIIQEPGQLLRSCTHRVYSNIFLPKSALKGEELIERLVPATDGFNAQDIACLWRMIHDRDANNLSLPQVLEIADNLKERADREVKWGDERQGLQAQHEAGHMMAGWYTASSPLTQVSLKHMDGKFAKPLDKMSQINDLMTMGLGGFCAERLLTGGVQTLGAHEDLQKVVVLAFFQVLRLGMSDRLGPVAFLSPGLQGLEFPYSKGMLQVCHEEIVQKVQEALSRTQSILQNRKEEVDKLAKHLADKGLLNSKDMENIVGSREQPIKNNYPFIPADVYKSSYIPVTDSTIRTAVHEAGHAIVAWYLPYATPLSQFSIKEDSGGILLDLRRLIYKEQVHETLCICLGGREAERQILNDINSGSLNDLLRVTDTVYEHVEASMYVIMRSVQRVIMEIFKGQNLPYNESLSDYIDTEAMKHVKRADDCAKQIVAERKDEIQKIAAALLRKQILTYAEMEDILGERPKQRRWWGKVLLKVKVKALLTVVGFGMVVDLVYSIKE